MRNIRRFRSLIPQIEKSANHSAGFGREIVQSSRNTPPLHSKKLTEADYRRKRFADHPSDVKNNPDLLNLTAPEMGGHLSSRRPPSRPRRLYPG